ncbi:hypothetical protein [Mycobacterium lepromatosis]|uniref:hypothetical protein n=1 Tax=Mycobacterium lepromatosis TaxID=480418 RepID=UPI000B0F1AD7|nr:hypothetical protein [Mycobacterium lepromatosis]
MATTHSDTASRPNADRVNKATTYIVIEQRNTMLSQQLINTAIKQLITQQQQIIK